MQKYQNFLISPLFFMLTTVCFDRKGDDGGDIYVYASTFLFFAAFLYFRLFCDPRKNHDNVGFFILAPVLLSFFNIFSDIFFVGNYIRAIIPFLMCYCMYDVIARSAPSNCFFILKFAYWFSIVSVVSTFIFGYIGAGSDLSGIRFQIISPMISVVLAVAPARLLLGRKINLLDVLSLSAVIAIVFISVTRGIMISVFASIFFAVIISVLLFGRGIVYGRVAFIFGSLFVFVLTSYLYQPDIFERWFSRVGTVDEYGFDPTSLTRLAEVEYQLSYLTSDLVTFLFGAGIGSEYRWSGDYDGYLSIFLSEGDLYGKFSYVGHNFWVYSVYAGGVFIGLLIPFILLFSFYRYFASLLKIKNFNNNFDIDSFSGACFCGTIFFIFILISTIGGNPFIARSGGASIGIFIGIYSLLCNGALLETVCIQPPGIDSPNARPPRRFGRSVS
jgi:hypothetical protein